MTGRDADGRRGASARVPDGEGGHDARRLSAVAELARDRVQPDDEPRSDRRLPRRARRPHARQLREKGLSRRVMATGQRVVKHRHVAEEGLGINAGEFAVLGVLLLRGAQTPGELKGRTERWHRFRSLEDVQEVLDRLAVRDLTQQLPRRPGQKEARWAQLLDRSGPHRSRSTAPRRRRLRRRPSPPRRVPARPVELRARAGAGPRRPNRIRSRSATLRPALVIRTVAITELGEIAQKVGRARARATGMGRARLRRRGPSGCRRSATCSTAELEECAQLTTQEMGKPIRQSRQRDRGSARSHRLEHRERRRGDRAARRQRAVTSRNEITYEPVGVVAHISAWNYPYFVGLNTIVPGAADRQRRAVQACRSTRRSPGCASSTCSTGPVCRSTWCRPSSAPARRAPRSSRARSTWCASRAHTPPASRWRAPRPTD